MIELLSIGDISYSRLWFSLETRKYDSNPRSLSFMKTYNGTIAGLVLLWGKVTIIAHIRPDGESPKDIPSHLSKNRFHFRGWGKEVAWKRGSEKLSTWSTTHSAKT